MNNTFHTNHRKDTQGFWLSETEIHVQGDVHLKLLTKKRMSGALTTTAQGNKAIGNLLMSCGSDFRKDMITATVPRVTSATVQAQHAAALEQIGTLLAEARAHYKLEPIVPA